MRMLRGAWDTEDLVQLEFTCIRLSYIEAFLHLTVNEEMPHKAAIEWLYFLAAKWPESRLAVHVKWNKPVKELIVG